MQQYLLGFDIGSSSIKAALVNAASGETVSAAQSPAEELPMLAVRPGWAEQDPEMWWEHTVKATQACVRKARVNAEEIVAIGISYQMHGLVCIDEQKNPVRPSIIWCDSRAVSIGEEANQALGSDYTLTHLLNSPGNFTASKLRWVQINEPYVYGRIYKVMLPGDYIAMKLTGEVMTTDTGLSEGMFWDFHDNGISSALLSHFQIDEALIPKTTPVFSVHGTVTLAAAHQLGLKPGTKISYRAGDQPNNAFSLNVLNPGETAATAGTSGVIYSVTDQNAYDSKSRVNTFIHVNNTRLAKRNGVLLCINGTGILNSWLRRITHSGTAHEYQTMNARAAETPVGADGLVVLPFGNGAERVLENNNIEASVHHLNFNRHGQAHLFRAAQEGIVFALNYGFDVLRQMDVRTRVIRAGHSNMFLSPLFREAFVNATGVRLELYNTDGAKGAAIGAGIGSGVYRSFEEGFKGLKLIGVEEPDPRKRDAYSEAYEKWLQTLRLYF